MEQKDLLGCMFDFGARIIFIYSYRMRKTNALLSTHSTNSLCLEQCYTYMRYYFCKRTYDGANSIIYSILIADFTFDIKFRCPKIKYVYICDIVSYKTVLLYFHNCERLVIFV